MDDDIKWQLDKIHLERFISLQNLILIIFLFNLFSTILNLVLNHHISLFYDDGKSTKGKNLTNQNKESTGTTFFQ
jgi:hypothetical protein